MENKTYQLIAMYTAGKASLEDTNNALLAAGSNVRLDPERNAIPAGHEAEYGLLITGTGSPDRVRVLDGRLTPDADMGDMKAELVYMGKIYNVHGTSLVAKE